MMEGEMEHFRSGRGHSSGYGFPPWEQNIPSLGIKHSHLGNIRLLQEKRLFAGRETASRSQRNGLSLQEKRPLALLANNNRSLRVKIVQ